MFGVLLGIVSICGPNDSSRGDFEQTFEQPVAMDWRNPK